MKLTYLSEALRMFSRRVRVSFSGVKRHSGNAEQICSMAVRGCFDAKKGYFRASTGHFCEFYCRDFGWSAESLVKLGYKKEVLSTLEYALSVFEKHGRVEQSISPGGVPFTFPDAYSPDALAFLFRALRAAGANSLVNKHKTFLEAEVRLFCNIAIDPRTGLVRKGVHFSSMKDYSVRSSSCYDNAMAGMLSEDLGFFQLANPLKRFDYGALLKKYFWTGSYFLDDLSGRKAVCGDANVIPFWSGIIKDEKMLRSALEAVRREHLDEPLPLKYTAGRDRGQKMIGLEWLAGDYERDAAWAHVGLMLIDVVSRVDKRLGRGYLRKYEEKILENGNFLEVYDRKGKPFSTPLYYSDEGMLWAANFISLKKELAR